MKLGKLSELFYANCTLASGHIGEPLSQPRNQNTFYVNIFGIRTMVVMLIS